MIGVKKIINIKSSKNGFSLVEMVVAVSLFVSVMAIMTTVFRNVIEGQRSAIAAQNTQESMRYVLEKMSKEIRTAKNLNPGSQCDSTLVSFTAFTLNSINKVYNTASGKNVLYFKNKNDECVVYYLYNNQIYIIHDGVNGSGNYGTMTADESNDYVASSTPDDIIVSNLQFDVFDDRNGAFHSMQPYVTIRMDVENKTSKAMHKQKMNLQTTISSRHYQ